LVSGSNSHAVTHLPLALTMLGDLIGHATGYV